MKTKRNYCVPDGPSNCPNNLSTSGEARRGEKSEISISRLLDQFYYVIAIVITVFRYFTLFRR